jgi:long-chain acyl-CoA synthetase
VCTIYPDGLIRITGRIKEIIVTSTGEKVPPADLEAAIEGDRLFAQSMVIGNDRPFISALCVVNAEEWKKVCAGLGLDPSDPASYKSSAARREALRRVKAATSSFPNYGVPRQVALLAEPWTIENGMLTPTLKIKRNVIMRRYADEVDAMYEALTSHK